MDAIGKFISEYIDAHEISMNELAERMGINGSTVSRHAGDEPPALTVEFLDKLASATGQDINQLVNLYLGRSGDIPTEALMKARDFASLPDDGQAAVSRLMRSYQSEKQR